MISNLISIVKVMCFRLWKSIFHFLFYNWNPTWYKLQLNDILLSLENFGFIRWVKLQKNLSLKELNKTRELHSLMRSRGNADYSKELISAKWYFSSFEEVLKNNPYLWLSTLNSWCPKYFDLKYIKVIKSLFTLQKLISQNITHGPLQNVWIESPKGKYRLICVPDFAYRWYCRMWNDALSVWCKPRIHSNYHGFIYNKGCLSWWKNFISQNWEKYDNIYEFDMASFFPNVNKKEGYEALIYFGVPKTYATHIINLVSGEIKDSKKYLDVSCFYEETLNKAYRLTNRNLPMGNALCPLISNLVLYKHFDELGFNVDKDLMITGYADDNMLLCTKKGYLELEEMIKHSGKNTLEEFLSDEYKGILIEPDKSGWIKKWGLIKKDLKNLGLKLDLKTSTLQGSTRGTDKNKPSTLELNLKTETSLINYSFLKSPLNMEKYFGFLQSRLYIGSWNYDVIQNFYLELDKESFGYKFGKFNWYNRKKYQLTIRNFTSYLNAKLFRFLIFKKRTFSLRNKIWQGANIPCWKEGNDKLYFKKYKEMSIQISQLKFEETWLFYRLKLNGLYVSSSSPLKIISAPKII